MTRVAIVGTGLIGASVGLAAKRNGAEVVGWDVDPRALSAAVERAAVSAAGSLEEALCDGPQQIPVADFPDFADEIRSMAQLMGRTIG